MMRFAWIILAFAVIGAAMVHFRLEQTSVQAETYRLTARRHEVRRTLWDRQIHLGELASLQRMHLRGEELALDLLAPGETFTDDQIVLVPGP